MYDDLINIIKDYIYKSGAEDFEGFTMSYNCSEVLLSERKFKFDYKYKKKIDFKRIDYLADFNIVDKKNTMQMMLYFLRLKALEVNFNLKLIKSYFENGYLSSRIIDDVIKSYPSEYKNEISDVISEICDQGWPTLEDQQVYILASLAATYMYDRIKNDKKYLNELFDLNQVLNDFDLSQVLDYLELEHSDFDLNNETYSMLRDKYKKFVKRW